jgi:hypothetical protein
VTKALCVMQLFPDDVTILIAVADPPDAGLCSQVRPRGNSSGANFRAPGVRPQVAGVPALPRTVRFSAGNLSV